MSRTTRPKCPSGETFDRVAGSEFGPLGIITSHSFDVRSEGRPRADDRQAALSAKAPKNLRSAPTD